MADANSNLTTLIGGPENMKLLFDTSLATFHETVSRQRAWEDIALRRSQNAATVDHYINMGAALAGQVGVTEGQQTVSPAGTAASETAKGAVAAAGAGIAVAAEGVATANQAIADAVANLVNALTAVVVTAVGGASTPSQTSSKPTAA